LLFFPIWIKIQGKDGLTTGTIAIFISFAIFLIDTLLKKKRIIFIPFLMSMSIVALISAFSVQSANLGPSLRRLVYFISSLMMFFVIVNYYKELEWREQLNCIEKIYSVIILMFLIQVVIGIVLYYIPATGKFFSLFTTADQEVLVTRVQSGRRLSSIIVRQESMGEILAILAPIVLYKITEGKKFYYVVYAFFAVGVVLSLTRSSILMFMVGAVLFFFFNRKIVGWSTRFIGLYLSILFFLVIVIYFPHFFDPIVERFIDISKDYHRGGSLIAAINRQNVWNVAIDHMLENLNLFGNGMVTIYNGRVLNYHNLYFTLIHQVGIIGFCLYIFFFGYLFYRLVVAYRSTENIRDKAFIVSCLISIWVFYTSELKFEFTRRSSYQQVIWIILGVNWLVSYTFQKKRSWEKISQDEISH
jgi:O-antigen ligase